VTVDLLFVFGAVLVVVGVDTLWSAIKK